MNSFHYSNRPKSVACRLLAIVATSFIILGGAQVANASLVEIWINDQVNGWQKAASDPSLATVSVYTTVNGAFKFTNSFASMTDGPNADLNSSTFHLQHIGAGSDSLQIAVIGSGFTAPTKNPIFVNSQVSGTNILSSLTALTFQSYVDNSNNTLPGSLAGGQGLQTPTVFPTISGPQANQKTTIFTDLASPFSVAHVFTLTMLGDGQIVSLGGDTALSPSTFGPGVPEPSSISLICICFAGFGGYSWRRRRQQQEVALSQAENASAV